MRRAIARGRVFPQSYSTDRRYGRLSLKACALFPLMWANADDQGRLPGDPEEVKYAVCPNIDHIAKADIPELLEELDRNELIKVYSTSKTKAIQILDWWQVQRLQWAWPSEYVPPQGWQDRLRYKKSAKEVVTENWPSQVNAQVSNNNYSGEPSGETGGVSPLTTPLLEKEKLRGKRRGRGNSPENSGEKTSTTSTETKLFQFLSSLKNWKFDKDNDLTWLREFRQEWPDFDVPYAKACRDYHSGRSPPKHKGIWKIRFRNWMIHERQYATERRETGESKGQRVKGARPPSDFSGGKW